MQAVIDLLLKAKRPVVHVGQGIRIAKAIAEFFDFVHSAQIPVLTARNGADLICSDHGLFVGRPGTFAQRGANFIVQSCDLYLAIGTRLGLAQTGYNSKDYARKAKIIQVDIDQAELDKGTLRDPLKVCMDAKSFLTELGKVEKWPDWSEWLKRCKELQAKYPHPLAKLGGLTSYEVVDALSTYAESSDIIVTDMGFAFQCTHQAFRIKEGQRLMTNCGLAPMGWGLPAAIGAAIGTGRRVICIVGDGGLMMNVQELSTVAHHKPNVKIILLNNGGYLTMKQSQELAFGEYMGSDAETGLSFPDWSLVCKGHGIPYISIHTRQSLHTRLFALFHEIKGPGIAEVVMSPKDQQNPKSVNRRIDGKIMQTPIEDSYPFLPPEEIDEGLRCEL